MIGPVIPFLSSELWTILQKQIKTNIDGYDLVKYFNKKSFFYKFLLLFLESKFIRTNLSNIT